MREKCGVGRKQFSDKKKHWYVCGKLSSSIYLFFFQKEGTVLVYDKGKRNVEVREKTFFYI